MMRHPKAHQIPKRVQFAILRSEKNTSWKFAGVVTRESTGVPEIYTFIRGMEQDFYKFLGVDDVAGVVPRLCRWEIWARLSGAGGIVSYFVQKKSRPIGNGSSIFISG